ncbi:hypothetical protein [Bradyrhizobium canariense]|jgi:hypothetical protein|uniref:hypothetical protein n=1 Tax=Bradyrhizobium canariense TaxID=255045 RepID=UPI001177BF76|nr:hypothetical protein [Bradyrhizobium canariense]
MEQNIPGRQKKRWTLPASVICKAKAASQFGASVAAAANVIQMDHSAAIEAPEEIIASERPRAPAAQFTGAIGLPG